MDYQIGFDDALVIHIQTTLMQHTCNNGVQEYPTSYDDISTLTQQYNILSGLSNYPWSEVLNYHNKVAKITGNKSCSAIYRSYCKEKKPASVRNKLIHYWVAGKYDYCDKLLTHHYDRELVNCIVVNNSDEIDVRNVAHAKDDVENSDEHDLPDYYDSADDLYEPRLPVRKTYRLVESRLKNMCRKETSYETFKSQITTNVFRWRCHSSVDIICMNDYDMDSGKLLTNMFVHVERRTNLRESVNYSCSCRVYKLAYAHRAHEMHSNLTCSHCLYCIDVIEPQFSAFFPDYLLLAPSMDSDSFIQTLLKNAVLSIGLEILHLTPVSVANSKHVFSVVCSDTDYSICILSVDFLICTQTQCRQSNRSKRKVCTLLKDGTTSCAHLQCMKRNYEHWEHMIKRNDNADSRESLHVCFFSIYFMVTFIIFI